jgi:hypothetical protein
LSFHVLPRPALLMYPTMISSYLAKHSVCMKPDLEHLPLQTWSSIYYSSL